VKNFVRGMDVEKKSNRYWFWAVFFNPVVLVIFGVFYYYLCELCQFGGVKRRLPVIIVCAGIIFVWFIVCNFLNDYRKNHLSKREVSDKKKLFYKILCIVEIALIAFMTVIAGVKIGHSAVKYNGKLSWKIEDIKHKRNIAFTHNNIYEDGIDGILQDIGKREKLPDELYLSSDFSLDFAPDGTILEFDTYLYGKNKDGETESFLISYDSDKSNKITVILNGVSDDSYDERMSLEPLPEMIKAINLKERVSGNQPKYSILYAGVRNWGYNSEGIIYIDKQGNIMPVTDLGNEIEGYTVSVYIKGKEEILIPMRYIATWKDAPEIEEEETEMDEKEAEIVSDTEFHLTDSKVYRLAVVDAAAGSRFYSLKKSDDGGETWQVINQDPFSGNSGVAAGISFIDENLGFISLSHSGGSYGEMYRTDDGGITFKPAAIPEVQVKLTETETYNPFDSPGVPTQKGNVLQLLVGQGQDGDYNGGCNALYQSEDNGVTWEFVKEE
jgi:uncharacterized membrane protein